MNTHLRLLLIDDDELDRQIVTRALDKSSITCTVVQAITAADGLKLAEEQKFDAIFLDYRLPDMDGLDVLKVLRGGQFEAVTVIMLSSHEDETLAEKCLEAGAQDFLLKDEVNGRRLTRAMRQARQRFAIEQALKSSREELRNLSERDPLTGLTNRRGFEIALALAIPQVRRSNGHLGIMLLDLDDFKSVNDTLGHDAGDVLLYEIAQRMSATVREGDLLCRLGGDEFVVLMMNFKEDVQAVMLADRIIARLREPILIGSTKLMVTASIGISILDRCAGNEFDLLKYADVAMYQAKHAGRNQSRIYTPELQEKVMFRAGIKHDLHQALENGEFIVYYQAQINPSDGSLGGMEALVRWKHPSKGILAPGAFLSVAEETGQIVDISNWVLQESCRQLKDWQTRLPISCPKLSVAVNLSAMQITQKSLSKFVRDTLAKYDLNANCLELEITESALIQDTSATVAMLSEIVALGVTLSLDDFGTGYSSLDHLKLFPIAVLKIDRGFISLIGEDKKNERLLVALIVFAKALEMKVVAEGVETKEQASFCIEHGCDLIQGYYYSRPVPAAEFEAAFLLR